MKTTTYKYINNTGNLSGNSGNYSNMSSTDMQNALGEWTTNLIDYNNKTGVDLSILPQKGIYNTIHPDTLNVPENANVLPNGKKLPTNNTQMPQAAMAIAGANPYAAAAMYALNGIASGLTSVQDNESLISDAGSSQANANGIGYQRQNIVSAGSVIGDYNKQTVQSLMTNPFEAATRWLMGGSQKKEALLAQSKSQNIANNQAAGALTKSLRLSNAKTYGDSSSQYLYGAKNGKLPKYYNGKPFNISEPRAGQRGAFTAHGYDPNAKVNSLTSPFEVIVSKNGEVSQNPGPMSMGSFDILPSSIKPTDMVVNAKNVPYFLSTGDKEGTAARIAAEQLESPTMMNNAATDLLFRAKCGKLPRFAEGWWGSAIPAMLGTAQGISQYLQARANKPYRPNTYVNNPYELDALSTLAGLRVNPYPIMQQLRSAETRTNRTIDRSGGLSVAQRNLSRLAALNNTQSNIANSLAAIQQQNNQYKANYAQAALNAGQNARQARMQANQWDLDYYSKAHAAQLNGMQTGLRNILGQVQGYQQNEFKRRQFNDMMELYRADQKQREEQDAWIRNYYANKPQITSTTPTYTASTKVQNPWTLYTPDVARQLAMLNYLGYKRQ